MSEETGILTRQTHRGKRVEEVCLQADQGTVEQVLNFLIRCVNTRFTR